MTVRLAKDGWQFSHGGRSKDRNEFREDVVQDELGGSGLKVRPPKDEAAKF
jgi:hypothetical protein